jgi:hypothetical protein
VQWRANQFNVRDVQLVNTLIGRQVTDSAPNYPSKAYSKKNVKICIGTQYNTEVGDKL